MSYIGNLPFGKTLRTVTSITADGVATVFYPDGGYDVNFVDVFVSGARLSSGLDFTAADGVSVTLLYTPVNGDTIDIVSYGLLELIDPVFPSTLGVGSNVVINTSSISVGNSTVNSIITSNSITIGGNLITSGNSSVQGLLKIVDSVSNTSSSIAASANSVTTAYTLAANAVSNATAYAATAYSNAVATAASDATTKAGTAYSNAIATAASDATTKAGTAYSNVFNGGTFSSTISVGANVSMNTTSIRVGNSTVNTYITSDVIYGPSTLYIDPAAAGDNTGLVVIKGDLQVDGTTFTINSTTVNIDDKNIVLADGAINNAATDGAGITIYGADANLTYNATGNNFEMSRSLSITGTANVSTGINVGANVNLSTSQINVGNSTVNTVISSASFTTTSNTVSVGTAAYVVANGNVGVGTSSPGSKLDILRSSTTTTAFDESLIRAINTGAATLNQRVDIGMRFQDGTYNGTGGISMIRESATARSGGLSFSSIGSDGNPTNAMRLDSSGNVGIGAAPTAVTGFGINKFLELAGASVPGLVFRPTGSTCEHSILGAGDGLIFGATGAATATNNVMRFFTSDTNSSNTPTERVRINSSGNLGVGTTSPAVRLQVNGGTRAGSNTVYTDWNSDSGGTYFENTGTSSGTRAIRLQAHDGGSANYAQVIVSGGSQIITFATNTTERARFNSTGALVFAGGTTTADGIGITFPATQSASTNANTLDDYEEGSWTPSLRDGGTNRSPTYQYISGTYIKIGKMVFIRWGFKLTSKGAGAASGEIQIYGLPFPPASTGSYQEENVSVACGILVTAANAARARMITSTGSYIFGRIGDNGDTPWLYNDLTDTSYIIGEMTYITTA